MQQHRSNTRIDLTVQHQTRRRHGHVRATRHNRATGHLGELAATVGIAVRVDGDDSAARQQIAIGQHFDVARGRQIQTATGGRHDSVHVDGDARDIEAATARHGYVAVDVDDVSTAPGDDRQFVVEVRVGGVRDVNRVVAVGPGRDRVDDHFAVVGKVGLLDRHAARCTRHDDCGN